MRFPFHIACHYQEKGWFCNAMSIRFLYANSDEPDDDDDDDADND